MMTMNRATLVGHAGRNPEMRTLPSGGEVALFSLATNERFKRRDGTEGESTEWHAIVAFGSAAQTVRKLVRRGAAVLVEGRIATRTWTDKSGTEHRTSEILVAGPQARVNVLTKRSRGPGDDDEPSGGGAAAGAAPAAVPEGTDLVASAASRQADAGAADATSDVEGDGNAEDPQAADRAVSGGAGSEAATCARSATGAVGETSVLAGTETEEAGAAAGAPASAGTPDVGGGEKAVPAGDAQAGPDSENSGAGETGGDCGVRTEEADGRADEDSGHGGDAATAGSAEEIAAMEEASAGSAGEATSSDGDGIGRAGEAMSGGEATAKTEGGASSDGVRSPAGADASDGGADASTGGDAEDAAAAETATAQAESGAAGNDEAEPCGHEAGGTAVAGVEPDAASEAGRAVQPDGADHG